MNDTLMSLRSPEGFEDTIDWSMVERGIHIIRTQTTMEAQSGVFASDYFYTWSLLDRLNSGKCIKRFLSLPDTATRVSPTAGQFIFNTIHEIEILGRPEK